MTTDEFLRWESGDDRRYELVDGEVVAMNLPAAAHRAVVARLAHRIGEALAGRRPCRVEVEVGLRVPCRGFSCYSADLAVTCAPHRRGLQEMEEPILVIEVQSPGTEGYDWKTKLPDYRTIASVQEVAVVDSELAYAEVHRRSSDGRWFVEIARGQDGVMNLTSVGLELPLSALYADIELAETQLPYRAG